MLKFIKWSVPGLLSVALVAGAGYFALKLPATSELSAGEDTHVIKVNCQICRLPYYGLPGQPSRFGPDPHAGEDTPGSSGE